MSTEYTSPVVSVVVPCRNEKDHIELCIQSILAQHSPRGGFEVIVADGMSDDGSREIVQRLARTDRRIRVVDNPNRITSSGMNAGIRRARGQYIAIMGAHNRYAADYLRSSVEVLQETGAENVGGTMICEGKSRLQKAIGVSHHSPFSVGGSRWHRLNYEGPADTVFGGVYRTEVFKRIGLFDEELVRNQDDEFNLRLIRTGGKIWHSSRIKSWYTPRNSLKALFRQYMQYGYWKVRVIQKHTIPASVRHLVPATFVTSLFLLAAASLWLNQARWLLTAVVTSYAGASLVASFSASKQSGWQALPLLPIVFATYHFGYGLGFLHGVLDFLVLRRRPSSLHTKLTRETACAD